MKCVVCKSKILTGTRRQTCSKECRYKLMSATAAARQEKALQDRVSKRNPTCKVCNNAIHYPNPRRSLSKNYCSRPCLILSRLMTRNQNNKEKYQIRLEKLVAHHKYRNPNLSFTLVEEDPTSGRFAIHRHCSLCKETTATATAIGSWGCQCQRVQKVHAALKSKSLSHARKFFQGRKIKAYGYKGMNTKCHLRCLVCSSCWEGFPNSKCRPCYLAANRKLIDAGKHPFQQPKSIQARQESMLKNTG